MIAGSTFHPQYHIRRCFRGKVVKDQLPFAGKTALSGNNYHYLQFLSIMKKNEKKVAKKEQKGFTEIVFILDRSGSMSGLEADTIGGYNSMLDQQKKEQEKAVISTVLFDDQIEILHDRKDLKKVHKITDKEYYVRGCTALLDAVGGAIHHIGNIHKHAAEGQRPAKTLFIITTDGMENASKRYSYAKVKKMVERQKKKYQWEFIFLGANIDAVEVAGQFGIPASRAVNYECDSAGTKLNFEVLSRVVSASRRASTASEMGAYFECAEPLAEIQEDYAKRHR